RNEREVRRGLLLDALSMLDRALGGFFPALKGAAQHPCPDAPAGSPASRRPPKVAEPPACTDAPAVRLERLLEVRARRVRARVHGVVRRELAPEMRDLHRARFARIGFDAPRDVDRLLPFLARL